MTAPPIAASAVFRHRDFRLFQGTRFLATLATQMQSVAVGWHVYSVTHQPMDLGYVGLAQFLPAVVLSLFSGDAVDRYDRRRIMIACHGGFALCAGMLWYAAQHREFGVAPVYAALVVYGTTRAFAGPGGQAIMPDLIPVEEFGSAVAWSETIWQGAAILGPALGGLLYGWFGSAAPVFAIAAMLSLGALAMMFAVRVQPRRKPPSDSGWSRLLAGIHYVWTEKVILGAISLDLFAVLLGGAVGLLPIYARDVLHVGPAGLGLLRSAPAIGASAVALLLAFRPLSRRAGPVMLACVLMFGIATVVFGLSRSFTVSLAALIVVGATDMISVVVRHTVVQLRTPADMRGRVSAVNSVFIGASNQLGEFESGITAAWFGAVPAVVLGGLGTCAIVLIWATLFPALRRVDRLIPESGS